MAANILRSERAIHMSVFVVQAFVRLREHVAANAAILKRLAEIDRTLLEHDTALLDLYEKLQPLLVNAKWYRKVWFSLRGPNRKRAWSPKLVVARLVRSRCC
jgi:hypothetical protein